MSDTQTTRMTANVDLHSDRPQVAKTKRPAADNSDKATNQRSKHVQEVKLRTAVLHYVLKLTPNKVEETIQVTPAQRFRPPTGTHGLPIDLTNYARSHWTHDLASGQTLTQNTPLSSRQPRLSYPDVIESPSGPAVDNKLFRLANNLLGALSHLGAGDGIVAIIFKRPDGEIIPGTSKTSISITRVGQQDMWKRLVKNMPGAGTWKGELRGYVRVQKEAHAK
jgi:hypothetical protein